MRATLEDIKTEIDTLVDWPTHIEKGAVARDTRLVVDVSNCSAIAYLCYLKTKGNSLEVDYHSGFISSIAPLKDAKKVAQHFVDLVNRVEGYVFDENY